MTTRLKETSLTYLSNLYEKDFYLWLQDTVKLLRNRDFDQLDIDNLIEEIESMGRREKKELKSRLTTLIEHLLKLLYWNTKKDDNIRSWRNTVIEQRRQIEYLLEDSPGLRTTLAYLFDDCYQRARKDLLRKSQLPSELFPSEPPFNLNDTLSPDYLPE